MLQKLAWVFGIVLLAVGVLGFVPGVTTSDLLLGIFTVDSLHNIIHILSGALALVAVLYAKEYVRLYFQVFGVVYGVVAVLGFVQSDSVLGLIMVNTADNLLHLVIAASALYAGFWLKEGGPSYG